MKLNYYTLRLKCHFGGEASKMCKVGLLRASLCGSIAEWRVWRVFVFFLLLTLSFSSPIRFVYADTVKLPPSTGVIGYWPMNEGAGTTISDISVNKNTGTFYGTPSWMNGKFGKGVYFNGLTDYILANQYSEITMNGTYSFSAWLLSTSTATQAIFQNAQNCSNRNGANLSGSTASFGYWNGSVWTGASGPFPSGKFFHFVGVNNGGTLSLYINGELQSGTAGLYVHCSGGFYLGRYSIDFTGNFKGIMDDVRVYNRALTSTEVRSIYQSGATVQKISAVSNLLGYWPLNGDYGDYSGRRNDFTVNGTCLSTTTDAVTGGLSVTGWATCGSAPSLQGYLSTGDIFNSASEFTFIAWVKGTGILWSGNPIFWLFADANGSHLDKYTGSWVGIASGTGGGTSANWRQLVVTKTSYGGIKIYSNTIEIASSTTQTFYTPTAQTIGRYYVYDDGSYHFTGKIDDVRLYNRILTQAEINELYKMRPATQNASKNNFSKTGLVGLWSFDGKDMNFNTGIAYDRSGQGNNGTLSNLNTTSAIGGKIGQALTLNGASVRQGIEVADNSSLQFGTGSFTLSAWIKTVQTGAWKRIITKRGGAGTWYSMAINNGNVRAEFYGSLTSVTLSGARTVNDGNWHMISTSYNSSSNTTSTYVDGILDTSTVANIGNTTNTQILEIGKWGSETYDSGSYTGVIDDARVYNRALSAAEIKSLYNAGR